MKLSVQARPGAKENKVEQIDTGTYRVSVVERPVRGQANAAIIRVLAEHLGIASSRVRIVSGHTSRQKTIEIGEGA